MNFDWVKKITLADLMIVLGLGLITAGIGIKYGEAKSPEVKIIKTEVAREVVVNINTATGLELEALPAIGPKTAQKIIEYRNKRLFKNKEEIMNVSGIGVKTYEKIKDKIQI